jgi:hypothetical protein
MSKYSKLVRRIHSNFPLHDHDTKTKVKEVYITVRRFRAFPSGWLDIWADYTFGDKQQDGLLFTDTKVLQELTHDQRTSCSCSIKTSCKACLTRIPSFEKHNAIAKNGYYMPVLSNLPVTRHPLYLWPHKFVVPKIFNRNPVWIVVVSVLRSYWSPIVTKISEKLNPSDLELRNCLV